MLKLKYLITFLAMALMLVATSGEMTAKTKKGDKLLEAGRLAEAKGDWDSALGLYEQAWTIDPQNTAYMAAMRRARFEAGQMHVDLGQKARAAGKFDDALREFEKALIADPSSSVALQDIRQTEAMRTKTAVKPDQAAMTLAERARREQEEHVDSMLAPPELKPMTQVIPMLKMNNQPPKVLFDTVGKLGGINVVFDPAFVAPARNFNVDLANTTIDQAFDYLATLTRTFWKPLNPTTIFVAEDNVTKRRDFEDDVVKVFYIRNATSVQEFQEIATAIRTVAEIRRVFTYNAQRAMIVRDTVDKVALAEKLVQDLDKPKAEVVVDVIVMSANTERTRDLAATIAQVTSSGLTPGLNVPITFNGTSTATTTGTSATGTPTTTSTGQVALSQLARLSTNQFSASLPGGLLQAMLADTNTRVLNKPQVRASDGQKVTLKIGSRIPYATGSFQTNTAAALVSTQFNYADVGVSIDMTPQVHSAEEVTLHIAVTVSSVQQYVNVGGISQPVIGQQANEADIRLREGEVNILGGLNQTQDSANSNGIPGLVNIPVLGHILFGNDHNDKVRSDLMIALIPHIVRTPDYTAENLRGIYAGTDQVVKINYAPKTDGAAIPATPGGTAPGQGAPAPAIPGSVPGVPGQPPVRQGLAPTPPQTNSTIVIPAPLVPAPAAPTQLPVGQRTAPVTPPAASSPSGTPAPARFFSPPPGSVPAAENVPSQRNGTVDGARNEAPAESKESVNDALMNSGTQDDSAETTPDQVARLKR